MPGGRVLNSLQAQARKSHLFLLGLLLLAVGTVISLLADLGKLHIENKLELAGLFAIAGFVVVIFQLWEANVVQRAKFLTDYLTKIYTDEDLNSAFHALVETYNDQLFDQIDAVAKQQDAGKKAQGNNAPVFDIFDKFQGERASRSGYRFYHPECFQGSEEERRLDALIGYLDIVGYHYWYGLIRMRDVAALLNYHLATFASRKVIASYLRVSGEDWWNTTTIKTGSGSAQLPYLYFHHMLGDFVKYNERNQARIRKIQSQIAEEIKGKYL
jgi:hypothetical protein